MSHIAKIELKIKDLNVLKKTCNAMGFQFFENQKSYKWYGRWVGDTQMPEGLTVNDLGKCDHAIRVPGAEYEIGVKKVDNHYELLWDYWSSGGLQRAIGVNGGLLKQRYTIEKVKMECAKKCLSVNEVTEKDGKIKLTVKGV